MVKKIGISSRPEAITRPDFLLKPADLVLKKLPILLKGLGRVVLDKDGLGSLIMTGSLITSGVSGVSGISGIFGTSG